MISAIVVNHNGRDHLRQCLESLRQPGPDIEVLVVGRSILRKDKQDQSLREDYKNKYELD